MMMSCYAFSPWINKMASSSLTSSISANSISMSTVEADVYEKIKIEINKNLDASVAAGTAPREFADILRDFLEEYATSFIEAGETVDNFKYHVTKLLTTVNEAIVNPHEFQANHQAIREPFDYYVWGNEFLKPLVIKEQSQLFGLENAKKNKRKIR